jgi:hypothetical protein
MMTRELTTTLHAPLDKTTQGASFPGKMFPIYNLGRIVAFRSELHDNIIN